MGLRQVQNNKHWMRIAQVPEKPPAVDILQKKPPKPVPEPPEITPKLTKKLSGLIGELKDLKELTDSYSATATQIRKEASDKINEMREVEDVPQLEKQQAEMAVKVATLMEGKDTAEFIYRQFENTMVLLQQKTRQVIQAPGTSDIVDFMLERVREKFGEYADILKNEVDDMIKAATVSEKIPSGKRIVFFPKKESQLSNWWDIFTDLVNYVYSSVSGFIDKSLGIASDLEDIQAELGG